MAGRAEASERLMLLISAFRRLLSDEHFVTLLRAERLADVPKQIVDRLN